MSVFTTTEVIQLYRELKTKANKLPLCSKEVVKVSQELDLFILQAMQNQIEITQS